MLTPLAEGTGSITLKGADRIVGRAGCLLQVINEAMPVTGALHAAFPEQEQRTEKGQREAKPGRAACRRFHIAASWLKMIIWSKKSHFVKMLKQYYTTGEFDCFAI